jgi:hypothetical protein
VLALAAAGSVLEMDGAFHQGTVFAFSLFGKFLLLFLSGRSSLTDGRLCFGSNRPDESQQFTSDRSNDLPLGLAGRTHPHIPLVQAVLRFPRNFLGLF